MTETHMLLVVIHIDALLEERSLAVMLGMLLLENASRRCRYDGQTRLATRGGTICAPV
jgi:hypothetical protein